MILSVIENDYISKCLGEIELPDDATEEEIDDAVEELTNRVRMGGLCHHCSGTVGDLSGAGEITVERDGEVIRDDSYTAILARRLDAAMERIAELEALNRAAETL